MIRILVDSSSDYSMEEIKQKRMEYVPITISLGGESFRDGVDATRGEMYEKLLSGKDFPKTSQPSPQAFLSIFEEAKAQGDEIICILLSSALSGTCQSANLAKAMADYEGIHIIDSLTATYPIRIMAEYAMELRDSGMPADDIVVRLNELRPRIRVAATLDTLEYLHRGGRLSAAAAAVGTLANLKPVVYVTDDGKVGVLARCLGKIKAQKALIDFLQEKQVDIAFPFYTIYSHGTENCEKLEEKLTGLGYSIDERLQIGLTIGAHIGPGASGIVFVEKA